MILHQFNSQRMPPDFLESLPKSLPLLLQEPTSTLRENEDLKGFRDSVVMMRTPASLLPGDLLYVPNRRLYRKVPRLGRMPQKLGNFASQFGGAITSTPLYVSPGWNERVEFACRDGKAPGDFIRCVI